MGTETTPKLAGTLTDKGYVGATGSTPFKPATSSQVQALQEAANTPALNVPRTISATATVININFDGTQNGEYPAAGESHTNVWQLSQMQKANGSDPLNTLYQIGVGAQTLPTGTLHPATGNPMPAASASNLDSLPLTAGGIAQGIVERAYIQLRDRAQAILAENPDAEISLNVAGFSRGSAQAVALANMINDKGIPGVFEPGKAPIASLTLLDPVDMTSSVLNTAWPTNVQNALVIVAMSEGRSIMPSMPVGADAIVVGIPGAHANIGGSFNPQGIQAVALQMMAEFQASSGAGTVVIPSNLQPDWSQMNVHNSGVNLNGAPKLGGEEGRWESDGDSRRYAGSSNSAPSVHQAMQNLPTYSVNRSDDGSGTYTITYKDGRSITKVTDNDNKVFEISATTPSGNGSITVTKDATGIFKTSTTISTDEDGNKLTIVSKADGSGSRQITDNEGHITSRTTITPAEGGGKIEVTQTDGQTITKDIDPAGHATRVSTEATTADGKQITTTDGLGNLQQTTVTKQTLSGEESTTTDAQGKLIQTTLKQTDESGNHLTTVTKADGSQTLTLADDKGVVLKTETIDAPQPNTDAGSHGVTPKGVTVGGHTGTGTGNEGQFASVAGKVVFIDQDGHVFEADPTGQGQFKEVIIGTDGQGNTILKPVVPLSDSMPEDAIAQGSTPYKLAVGTLAANLKAGGHGLDGELTLLTPEQAQAALLEAAAGLALQPTVPTEDTPIAFIDGTPIFQSDTVTNLLNGTGSGTNSGLDPSSYAGYSAGLSGNQAAALQTSLGNLGLGSADGLTFIQLTSGGTLIQNADGDLVGQISSAGHTNASEGSTSWLSITNSSGQTSYIAPSGAVMNEEQYANNQLSTLASGLGLFQSLIGLDRWDSMSSIQRLSAVVGIYNQFQTLSNLGDGIAGGAPTEMGLLGGALGLFSALEGGNPLAVMQQSLSLASNILKFDAAGLTAQSNFALDIGNIAEGTALGAEASASLDMAGNFGAAASVIGLVMALESGNPYSIASSTLSLMSSLGCIGPWGAVAAVVISILGGMFAEKPDIPMSEGHALAGWDESGNLVITTDQNSHSGGPTATSVMRDLAKGIETNLASLKDEAGHPKYELIADRLPSVGYKYDPDGYNISGGAKGHLFLEWTDEAGQTQTRYYDGAGSRLDGTGDTIAGDFAKHAASAVVPSWEALKLGASPNIWGLTPKESQALQVTSQGAKGSDPIWLGRVVGKPMGVRAAGLHASQAANDVAWRVAA